MKFWDLAAGKCQHTLTYHKKGVRALALHPREFTLSRRRTTSKLALPDGRFMHNMLSQQKSIVNSLSVNEDDVVVSGGDNGSLYFWDYKSGHNFQQRRPRFSRVRWSRGWHTASGADRTGTRLITVEADKTIKMEGGRGRHARDASQPELRPPRDLRRY